MIRVAEISECFPNKHKPQTGEFILRHAAALSEHCTVKMIAPLRLMPPREAVSAGIRGLSNWLRDMKETSGYSQGDLTVEYMNYSSLPRPSFEAIDENLINALFHKKLFGLVSSFSPDVLLCHWLRPWSRIAGSIANELAIPFIIDHHEDLPTLKALFPEEYRNHLATFSLADKVIVHSTQNKIELEDEIGHCGKTELIYLGQGFEISEEEKSFGNSSVNLICVSHLYESRKNIDLLLRALAVLKDKLDFRLRIIGDGPLRSGYEGLSRSLGIDTRVSFEGRKSQEEIRSALDESDLFVLPSYPEAFGIVFAEALSRGVPVIACKGSGGGEELRILGYPSVLAEPDSVEDLSEKIHSAAGDAEALSRMSSAGKSIVRDNFTWKNNAFCTFELLKSLTEKNKSGSDVRN